jgi:hypothetical protein
VDLEPRTTKTLQDKWIAQFVTGLKFKLRHGFIDEAHSCWVCCCEMKMTHELSSCWDTSSWRKHVLRLGLGSLEGGNVGYTWFCQKGWGFVVRESCLEVRAAGQWSKIGVKTRKHKPRPLAFKLWLVSKLKFDQVYINQLESGQVCATSFQVS